MDKRGRKSSAELSVVIPVKFGQRPEAPADLTPRQAELWRAITSSEPADFFSTEALRGLLSDYCRHRESAESITSVINTFQADWLKNSEGARRYQGLLRMREMETRAAASIATKLRLTNQSRYTPQAAATAAKNGGKGFKPWEM